MKTLVGLLRLCKWFSYQKSVKLRRNVAKGVKNKHSEKKIQKILVLKNGIPIMRLHRHGGCESLHANSRFG
ncbi:hypothetical protein [Citrobacter freundii]|uniref:Uncharacterized protein n=10 Tax=Bacteria TaxID=2 RepID=A0AB33H6I0_CITFR|nr:hypothetical protein [Citrobacter freundii]PSF20714.1 hypothetical protein C6985_19995 [Escherichia coli]AOI29600.1 hypothetical protein BFQ28_07080 [Citrobacter freundii]ATX97287.1 hypothetical protein AM349_14920 [Citrobacter freundii]AUU28049.1 hypothetical protein MC62_019810 [Citrobacter freundii]AXZ50139.1 hypothetical protein AM363_26155 [Citrobacter freundii]